MGKGGGHSPPSPLSHGGQFPRFTGVPLSGTGRRHDACPWRGGYPASYPHETETLEAWTDQQIDERLGFKPIHLTAGDDVAVFSGAERQNREWTPWLLMVVLAMAFVETGLAWLCGRPW